MPPALPKCKLSDLQPTDEELRVARESVVKLKEKEALSKKASLRAYLKQNPDNISKGNMTEMLEKFIIIQSRAKDQQKKGATTKSDESKKRKFRELHWWSQEQMEQNFGKMKAKSWMESNMLPSRPDRVTGKNEDPNKEYGVPVDCERLTESEIRALKVEFEMQDVDGDAIEEVDAFRSGADSSAGPASTEKSEIEKMAENIETLKANLPEEIAKLQSAVPTAKLIKTKADSTGSKYHEALITDSAKLISQGEKLIKILERMALEPTDDTQMPKVISQLDDVKGKSETVTTWATTYGLMPEKTSGGGGSSSKRRRRGKASD